MKPIFTIHAGEYLVGSHIEREYKSLSVWVPTKDTGIDLLVTDKQNKKAISIQAKFSKDFLPINRSDALKRGLKAVGWYRLNREKIENSRADRWVFVLYPFNQKNLDFIIIPPGDLIKKLGKGKVIQTYFYVTKKNKCWEARDLRIANQVRIAEGKYSNKQGDFEERRDFTHYLNNWKVIESL